MNNAAPADKAITDFFDAFNRHDAKAYLETLHFPHVRINGAGNVTVSADASEMPSLDFVLDYLAKNEGWHHSSLDAVEQLDLSDRKAHFKIRFTRYHEDDTAYAVHDSLWVITQENGHWGVLARSSFAP